jgi:hypothetical protein
MNALATRLFDLILRDTTLIEDALEELQMLISVNSMDLVKIVRKLDIDFCAFWSELHEPQKDTPRSATSIFCRS